MADFLLELFSEEIPARMQVQAAKDLERLVVGALSDRGLLFEAARGFSGPRLPIIDRPVFGPMIEIPRHARMAKFLVGRGVFLEIFEKEGILPPGDLVFVDPEIRQLLAFSIAENECSRRDLDLLV